jgi:hypothetical protein
MTSLSQDPFGENRGPIGIHANRRGPRFHGDGLIEAPAAKTPWKSQQRQLT